MATRDNNKHTTLGRLLINDSLPPELRTDEQLGKKQINRILSSVARNTPEQYGSVAQNVKRSGDYVATLAGLSVGLEDVAPQRARRDPIVKDALGRLRKATTDAQRRVILSEAQGKMMKITPDHPSDMALMAAAGGRGSTAQLMRTVAAPVAAADKNGAPLPWLIQRSYSEGLRPDESWVAGIESRNLAIQTKESVQEPGAFGKVLIANMSDMVISSEDCGTRNGTIMHVSDPQLVDRVLAAAAGPVAAGTIVTAQVVRDLRKADVKDVKARTPLTCEMGSGVCSVCMGADEWGKLPRLNTNVGVRAAQAMSEPLTQFALSAKHGAGTLSGAGRPSMQGLTGLKNFLDFPKSFSDRAILTSRTGVVTRVAKAPQGGWYVDVDRVEHYLSPRTPPTVHQGQHVDVGDVLSEGVPTPDDVVRLKDMGAGRQHVADVVHGIYAAQGANLDKRHMELLAKSHLNWVRVVDDPDGDLLPGEIVPYSSTMSRYGESNTEMAVQAATGKVLSVPALQYTAGTTLTPQIVASLKGGGVSKVRVYNGNLRTRPVVKSLTRSPLLDARWMRRLGHRYLKKSLVEGAAAGDESSIHDTDPIAAYAYGAEFGDNPSGVGY